MTSSPDTPHPTPPVAHEEIELKWALTASNYQTLLEALADQFGPGQQLAQENRFYDTDDSRLRHARMNVRIRHENDRWQLTCKSKPRHAPHGILNGLARHHEWETWLPGEPQIAALPLPDHIRQVLGGEPLRHLGGFSNRRIAYHIDRPGLSELLCLDRTDFGIRTDYELEIETADPTRSAQHWAAQLSRWGIIWAPQHETKFARFLGLMHR